MNPVSTHEARTHDLDERHQRDDARQADRDQLVADLRADVIRDICALNTAVRELASRIRAATTEAEFEKVRTWMRAHPVLGDLADYLDEEPLWRVRRHLLGGTALARGSDHG